MNRRDYINKAFSLLNDEETYCRLNSNPLNRLIREYNSLLDSHLLSELIKKFKTLCPSLGYFYGLLRFIRRESL